MAKTKCPKCEYTWTRRKHTASNRIRCPSCGIEFVSEEEKEFREKVVKEIEDILNQFNRGLKSKSILRLLRIEKDLKVSGPYICKLMTAESQFYHGEPNSGGVVRWRVIKPN